MQKKVYEALHAKFILGQKPKNLSADTKAFFEKFQYYVKQDPVAEYQLFEELQELENREEQKENIQVRTEIRNRISFLESAGQEPVQWLEEYEAERRTEQQDVMSQVLDLHLGDQVIVKAPFADKIFTITKHNRTQRIIVAESEDGEQKRILYRSPAILESFVRDVKKVIPLAENKPPQKTNQEMEEYLSNTSWEIEQLKRRMQKNKAA